mmetsp:Transcript_88466/g.249333  ORF Transcript_88466/g.249333 Transcript_88466/m.249333 type:complete len:249 (-) Transcript_88466:1429-2175(-)
MPLRQSVVLPLPGGPWIPSTKDILCGLAIHWQSNCTIVFFGSSWPNTASFKATCALSKYCWTFALPSWIETKGLRMLPNGMLNRPSIHFLSFELSPDNTSDCMASSFDNATDLAWSGMSSWRMRKRVGTVSPFVRSFSTLSSSFRSHVLFSALNVLRYASSVSLKRPSKRFVSSTSRPTRTMSPSCSSSSRSLHNVRNPQIESSPNFSSRSKDMLFLPTDNRQRSSLPFGASRYKLHHPRSASFFPAG